MKFNENLKYLRKQEGLTQEELAEKLNVSRQSVTKWESGQALPDIDKVKEIAYLFSVTIDSLVGDIESKTTNKLKRKIDDIGWVIFIYVVLSFMMGMEIHNFIEYTFNNESITVIATVILTVLIFVSFIAYLKKYLNNTQDIIINMKENEEGKKERKTYIRKKYLKMIAVWCIFTAIYSLSYLQESMREYLYNIMKDTLDGGVIIAILAVKERRSLEKKVKELNK